jgi:conjugative transfer signal peptidase TraF
MRAGDATVIEDRHAALPRWLDRLRTFPWPRRLRRRALAIGLLFGGLGLTIASPPRPLLVWNPSASAPIGLYAVGGRTGINRGDMVIAWVPDRWRRLAATRRYIPLNVPLVKRVAAVPGDVVCATDGHIFVDGRWAAWQRPYDGRDRPMPAWHGCATLGDGAFLLLMDAPDSFDGRYFGPTGGPDIIGKATLLWAR